MYSIARGGNSALIAVAAVDDFRRVTTPVFVIEDDPDHRKIAELVLKSEGADSVTFFSTGEEAIEFFMRHHPSPDAGNSIIFIDLMLPNIGGLEILKRLKSNEYWKSARMIVLTCSTDNRDRILSQQYGAEAFLTKPLFGDFVRRILASSSH